MKRLAFYKIFNLVESHFNDGWANIDTVSLVDIQNALKLGCVINLNIEANAKSILGIDMKDDIFAFGKVHKNGTILLEGIQGFPFLAETSTIIEVFAQRVKSKRIDSKYVYVEW